jgi:hypothetical protein
MIPNPWNTFLDSREVPRGRPVSVVHVGERILLWRDSPIILYRRHRRALLDAAGIPEKP